MKEKYDRKIFFLKKNKEVILKIRANEKKKKRNHKPSYCSYSMLL